MARTTKSKRKRAPKTVLKLPDLEQSRSAVLNSLTSPSSQRSYDHAIREFIDWYCSEPRLAFNKTVVTRYRISLEQRHYAPSTINLRLAAVRRLAYEASDCGLLSPDLAAGIRRVKGARRLGVRIGNWLTAEESRRLISAFGATTPKERRNRAMIAVLAGCGLRRAEASALKLEDIQLREAHWVIADLNGKDGHIRTVPMLGWVKRAIDDWAVPAGIPTKELDLRRIIFPALTPRLTRREMLQATAGLGVSLAMSRSALGLGAALDGPQLLDLGGDMWTMREEGNPDTTPASIPGSTYTNLLAAGEFPDPFFGENNGKVQWVAEKNWFFERGFDVSESLHDKRHLELVCHGLDTLATLWLNGHQIGSGNNMFRTWTFDIKPHLRRGTNHLRIRFDALAPYIAKQRAAYRQQYGIDLPNERSWVRKAPYMWGWDWCRPILTQGIWRKIEVLGYDARIADLAAFQNHQADGSVQLEIHATAMGQAAGSTVKAHVSLAGDAVAEATGVVTNGAAVLSATIPKPELWWPNGMGNQPLYAVVAELVDATGESVDTASRRVGLRKIEVLPPSDGVAMHIRVNGAPVFAKGADWIPADNMPTRVTPEILRWYMTTAVACNFNFIRLWGGGYYEEDELFDLSDEMGLMLQFEFKFANTSYPVNDQPWMDNLRAEIEEQTRRCRNHPSIVIWSGNNEIKYFEGYNKIFKDTIGGIVEKLLPGAFYEVGSGAHGSGDIHTWGVWHGNQPVESYGKIEGFVTEFGMQSTPAPMTVRAYTDAADSQSVDSPVMRYHELDGSGDGIGIIMHYTESDFGKAPESFDDTLWLTDVNQAWAMRYGVEHWRRDMPRSMAAAIWQYNDCWPCSTWAMVDYYRRVKAVLYQSRHFFAPILVSGLPDAETGQAAIYVTSDRQQDFTGNLLWTVTSLAGEVLRQGSKQIGIPARTSRQAEKLDLLDLVKARGAANLLVWPELAVNGLTVARNTLLFVRPKELKLMQPNFVVQSSGGERRYTVVIESEVPALWVWANVKDRDASYSDNFVDLRQGRVAQIDVQLDKPMAPFDFRRKLEVRSVYDIAPEMKRFDA